MATRSPSRKAPFQQALTAIAKLIWHRIRHSWRRKQRIPARSAGGHFHLAGARRSRPTNRARNRSGGRNEGWPVICCPTSTAGCPEESRNTLPGTQRAQDPNFAPRDDKEPSTERKSSRRDERGEQRPRSGSQCLTRTPDGYRARARACPRVRGERNGAGLRPRGGLADMTLAAGSRFDS